MTKKIHVDLFVFLQLLIYRKHLHVSPPVGKCAQFLIFCLWAKILSSFQIKPFKCSIFEKIHITESYLIKVLVNIWNLEPRKENLQDFAWSKPLKKCWTGVTFGHLSSFSWPKTIIYGTP